ncbi:hypothetical protein [Serratia surfactantfaciens]|uniref:LA2681-like HEPN domain-containing protein n=1 Tax=Serratia surfactantfaciens TaxID=2741499 RepID=A0ABS0LWP1_9GAMM|nr:hypothetical protein [Serratia surfactantfaciens]MBH1919753.1 hypothetical protein [Serratia surfactantfaciens]
MKKILGETIARILYNLLKQRFDDIESIAKIKETQDFKLLISLDALYKRTEGEDNVDYDLVVGAYNKINHYVGKLNKENCELISHILKIYNTEMKDDFLISGTLYNHEKKISFKLSSPWINKYRNYISALDSIICDFRMALLNYENADCQDVFFDSQHIIQERNINFEKSAMDKKSIYLDTNTIQILANELRLEKRSDYSFVYSSYLVVDVLNSNPLFLNSFFSDLFSLTNGVMVGYMNEGLCYVTEKIEHTVARAQKYFELTKIFESTIALEFIKNFHTYPELRKGRELSNALSCDVIGFFKGNKKETVSGFNHVKNKFLGTSICEFIISGRIDFIENYRAVIGDLISLFDFVNFETEHLKLSNVNKISSSYRDREHLEHGYICDYFVTEDRRLKNRAEIIYGILGVKTKVIGINDLKKLIY